MPPNLGMGYIRHFNSRTHVECDSLVPSNVPDTRDFNSRTHVECDMLLVNNWKRNGISTHALTWSATVEQEAKEILFEISTHALTWSATHRFVQPGLPFRSISTHALTWSATTRQSHSIATGADFNSRTHVECDNHCFSQPHIQEISTHALTWSATWCIRRNGIVTRISTHALTWSATAA